MRPGRSSGANTADRVPTTTSDLPAADALPLVVALAVGQPAVLDRHPLAERCTEGRGDCRRQRDLRNEHEHLPVAPQDGCGQPQVDLGLAAGRHAVQHHGPELLAVGQLDEPGQRVCLLAGQLA